MSPLVLDASIAANWLLDDELDTRAASVLAWLRQDEAIVPQLWHYEIRNALLMAERRGRVTREQITERLHSLRELPILTNQEPDFDAAFYLARAHNLSFYDALYLELAKRIEAPLATLDTGLLQAATAEGLELPSA